jgi:hypothetical protein
MKLRKGIQMNNPVKTSIADEGEYLPILDIGAEGGAIRLVGLLREGVWQFKVQVNDVFVSTEYREIASEDTWLEALAELDRYPWHCFYPDHVCPEFAKRIWQAYEHRHRTAETGFEHYRAQWKAACVREPRKKAAVDIAGDFFL